MNNARVEQGQLAVVLDPPQVPGSQVQRSSFLHLTDNGEMDYTSVARFRANPSEKLRIHGINDPSGGDYLRQYDFMGGMFPSLILGWDVRGTSGAELDVFAVYNQTIPAYQGPLEGDPNYDFYASASGATDRNQATVIANSVVNVMESKKSRQGASMTLLAHAEAGSDRSGESAIGLDNSTINFGRDSNSLLVFGGVEREKEGPNNNTFGFTAMKDSVLNMGGGDDRVNFSGTQNLIDEESFFTYQGGLFQGKSTINGGDGFDVVEIDKPVDGYRLTIRSGLLAKMVEKETGAKITFSDVERVRFFGGTNDTDNIIGLDKPRQDKSDVNDSPAIAPIQDSELASLDLLDLLAGVDLSQDDLAQIQDIFAQDVQSLPDALRRFLVDAGVSRDEIRRLFDDIDITIDSLVRPSSFKRRNATRLSDVDPSVDQVVINVESFGVASGDALIGFAKNPRKARTKYSRREFDFIYEEKKGGLYFNENGADNGFGDGGLFAILKGSPALDESSFDLI